MDQKVLGRLLEENKVLHKKIEDLENQLKKQRESFELWVQYLQYTIENPPKYKIHDKVKTFVVSGREYKCLQRSESSPQKEWQHGYTLKCTLTNNVTEKFFTEWEIAAIIKNK